MKYRKIDYWIGFWGFGGLICAVLSVIMNVLFHWSDLISSQVIVVYLYVMAVVGIGVFALSIMVAGNKHMI